jgi:tRNA nucleotidyltransferase (CCA-adding enzyme)
LAAQDERSRDPILRALEKVGQTLDLPIYLVGGYPRDLLLGRSSVDYDVVVLEDITPISQGIAQALDGELLSSSEFETAKVRLPDGIVIDVARARRERYPRPGALPIVEAADDLNDDLGRRDFTLNAMAFSLNPLDLLTPIDPFGGGEDLGKGLIRVLREGSFAEDPTRAFRAVRYRNRFRFDYTAETNAEFDRARAHMTALSFERIRNELLRIAAEVHRADMLIEIEHLGLLKAFRGDLGVDPEAVRTLDELLEGSRESDWALFFGLFLAGSTLDTARPGIQRDERKILDGVRAVIGSDVSEEIGELHRALRSASKGVILVIAALRPEVKEQLLEYVLRRSGTRIELTGDDVMSLGVRPGPDVGEALLDLFIAKLRGEVKEDETSFIREWVKKKY